MRIAVWQGYSPAADPDLALEGATRALRAAAAAGAGILVLPELWLPGYNAEAVADLALTPDSAPMRQLAEAARNTGCALVLGYAERAGERIFNSAAAFGPDGALLANYRKIQLFGPRESRLFSAGDSYLTFPLGAERIALLICYDVEFAPHVAALAARGATLLLVPTANMQPFHHVPAHTIPAMAANHGLAIAYANYCGSEGDLTYTGGSVIAGPHGEILAQAGEHPALLVVDLPPRDPARLSTQGTDLRQIP
ncbi:nitrilase-related carbon-nitrogen hydrolase [Pseudogemmobacter sonorensis]|uniref:nitrilase-related carbon-nitrogen hydrolase n=1 Tax=Pseudogemmobacter sonorensis TaxID=2989681 RepID=UPI003673C6B0